MDIGFKIKKLRESKNLSQQELTDILGVSQGQLSKIESGKAEKIDFLFMQKVCDFFEVDFRYFTEASVQNNVNNNKKGVVVGNCGKIKIVNEKKSNKNNAEN